jgi:hypothetical protein
MAASSLDICNSALHKLGATRISSLSGSEKAAIILNDRYDTLRKEVLRSHPWNFAIAYVSLAPTVNTPVWDKWKNEFVIPSDVLRVLETDVDDYNTDWEIGYNADGNKVIFTNTNTLKIKYIKDVTNTTRFAPDFEEALAFRIAADIAYAIVQSTTVQQNMFQLYEKSVALARSFDSQENALDEIEANTFIDIRG